jgi:hypothetical protein
MTRYIDIEVKPHPLRLDFPRIFSFLPSESSFEIATFTADACLYKTTDDAFAQSLATNLHDRLCEWINSHFPDLDHSAVRFCTYHLASHFIFQYCSSYSTAKCLAHRHPNASVICRDSVGVIERDWCSAIVNLLALENAYAEDGLSVTYLEAPKGVLEHALHHGFTYEPTVAIYNPINEGVLNRSIDLFKVVSNAKNVHYSLMGRYVDDTIPATSDTLYLHPKTAYQEGQHFGLSWQFCNSIEIPPHSHSTWKPFLSKSVMGSRLESLFFESIFIQVVSPLAEIEKLFYSEIVNSRQLQEIHVDEIVDIEALGLLSACKRAGVPIVVTQHSSNAVLRHLSNKREGKLAFFPDRVVASNAASASSYQVELGNEVSVSIKHSESTSTDPTPISWTFEPSRGDSVLIIENDFFRSFGTPFPPQEVVSDIITCLQSASHFGLNKFIWRQRGSEFSPILALVKNSLPTIEIIFDCSSPKDLLAKHCFAAIGFGWTSTLAIELIARGLPYFFGSCRISDIEYIAATSDLYDFYGPLDAASRLKACRSDEKYLLDELLRQRQILIKHYGEESVAAAQF